MLSFIIHHTLIFLTYDMRWEGEFLYFCRVSYYSNAPLWNIKQIYIHIPLSLSFHCANKIEKHSPSLDLVEKPAKVFGQMQSSACQSSGRTPSPVPQANCKPVPWSTWQMAYPSHYRKMNNRMKNS